MLYRFVFNAYSQTLFPLHPFLLESLLLRKGLGNGGTHLGDQFERLQNLLHSVSLDDILDRKCGYFLIKGCADQQASVDHPLCILSFFLCLEMESITSLEVHFIRAAVVDIFFLSCY